ncbi:uncharacterized protein LOC115076361 isoform X2 [Rhinatrema bivittatum]|uniref:uncharacterized protein LOC115076361 isoform X2 n=1 Tax=Rhinatrema bivittatum TaxID=194408 RepID=UPI0011293D13|nr:uncharacterized protein LOC115076361 isoform X2 [Rhinatrema bivittatum]
MKTQSRGMLGVSLNYAYGAGENKCFRVCHEGCVETDVLLLSCRPTVWTAGEPWQMKYYCNTVSAGLHTRWSLSS